MAQSGDRVWGASVSVSVPAAGRFRQHPEWGTASVSICRQRKLGVFRFGGSEGGEQKGRIFCSVKTISPSCHTAPASMTSCPPFPSRPHSYDISYPNSTPSAQSDKPSLANLSGKSHRDLQDFGTAYNTLNITGIPYAGPGGITVSPSFPVKSPQALYSSVPGPSSRFHSPVLLRAFAHTVMESDSAGSLDVNFALLCLNHPPGNICPRLPAYLNTPSRGCPQRRANGTHAAADFSPIYNIIMTHIFYPCPAKFGC